MKLRPYVDKLNNSKEYKQFTKDNNDAFVMAGFFVIDYEFGNNIHQIDYFLPSKKKIAAFTLDGKVNVQILKTINNKTPEKLDLNTKVDLDVLKGILEDEMKNRTITGEIRKMIAILQCVDGKQIWNINCVLSGMELLRVHVEDSSKSVLKMEKSSIMELLKRVPPGMKLPGQNVGQPPQMQMGGGEQVDEEGSVVGGTPSNVKVDNVKIQSGMGDTNNIQDKLKALEKLGKELENEKGALEVELKKRKALKSEKVSSNGKNGSSVKKAKK